MSSFEVDERVIVRAVFIAHVMTNGRSGDSPRLAAGVFTHRVTSYPAPGKGPELRALLEKRVRSRQSEGYRTALMRTMYGEACFAINFQFESLAARESAQLGPLPAEAFALTSRLGDPSLHEVLVPANLDGRPVKYIEVRHSDPLPGKGGTLQRLLADRVQQQQAADVRAELSVEIAGPRSQVVTVSRFFESLAEYEESRAQRQGDEGAAAVTVAMAPLVSRHVDIEILEVLVPFPPRA